MKVLMRKLAAGLQRLSPPAITAIGVCLALVLGELDYVSPRPMSFTFIYLLIVVFVGWGAGKWPAMFSSFVAILSMAPVQWNLHSSSPHSLLIFLWNNSTRLLVFCIAGWLTAEVTRLTRHLGQLVEERTAQWKAEVEQHKATSTRLGEAVERFEQVINNITEVFWLTNAPKNQMAYVSPGYERVWGRKCAELYREPMSWAAAVHPADRDQVLRRAQTDQASGSYDVEYRIVRPDGAVRWIRDRAFPVRNAQGEVYRIAGLAEDITERKTTQETLQTQAGILENMAEGVVVTDEKGVIVQMNPASERIWGYERNEVLGQPASVFSALPEPEATAVLEEALAALQATGSWRGTFKNRRKDGATIFCEAVISRLEVKGRRLMVAVEQDVTERKEAESALVRQEALYRTLFELSPNGILLEDASGNILDVNQALCESSGYTRQELLRSNVRRFVPAEDQSEVEAHLAMLRAGPPQEHEVWNLRKSGERRLIRLNEKQIALPDGSQRILVVTSDVTERRRSELTKQVFLSLGTKLSAVRTPVEAARAIYATADQFWKWDAATLSLYFQESDWMEPVLFCDVIDGQRREVAPVSSAGAPTARRRRVMQEGAELLLRKESELQGAESVRFGDVPRPSASIMYVPMRREDQPIGVLSIQSYKPNAYTQEDLRTLQALADHCAGALERIRTEQALQQREELNRTILATAMDGFYALDFAADPGGAITEVNDAFCRLSGYRREELLQMRIADLEAAESPKDIARHQARIIAAGADRFETRHRRKDGQEVHVEISVSRLAGSSDRVFGFVRDITERKRAELMKEAFLSLGTKLSEVQSPLTAGRAVYATADQLWQWDAAVMQLYSPERDCLDSVLLIDVVDGERREVPPPYPDTAPPLKMRQIMQNGAELILRTPADMQPNEFIAFGSAERLSASLMYVPLRREGIVVGVLSIQSYTPNAYTEEDLRTLQALADYCGGALERIQAEAALRQAHDDLERRVQERTAELQAANRALAANEARLELALDASSAGTWSWDVASNTLTWDDRCHALYGFELHEPRSFDGWFARIHPEAREGLLARIRTLAEPGGGDHWNEEFRVLHPVKGERWLAGLGRVERDQTGRAVRVAGINLDITERKLAEQALREARDTLEARVQERTAELQAANAALGESEERYRSLVNNLNVGVYRNTPEPEGRFIQTNPALLRMHGYDSVAEFQKLRVADLYQEAGERKAFVAELLRQGAVVDYELRLKKKDGTPIYGSINATIHRGPNGEPDWIDGMIEDITQRKQAEKALRASEERYRALAESSPDAIFILDRDMKMQYVNSRTAALWRRAPKELIGLTQSELFPPEEAKLHCRVVAEVFETGQAVRRDALVTFPVGEQWIEIGLVPLFGEPGTVSSVMGACRDITERKRAERQLAEALDLNQKMIAASTLGIAAYKASGECVFANDAMARITGGSISDVLQENFRVLKSWQESGLLRLAEEALSQGQARLGEAYTSSSFGRTVWLDCHMAPFVSNGRPHLLLMALDITERKRAEDAFKQAERLQRAILDTIPDPAWLKDAEGRFLACNQAMSTFYGRPVESFLGKTLFDCVPPEAARSAREDTEVMTTRLSVVTEVPVADAQGRARWHESIKSPLFNERDEVIGTVGIARDVTERRRLEGQILEISDREQARIGQDIHDGLCQQLVSLAFDANSLHSQLSGKGRPEVKTARRIADCLDQAITETRRLSRGLFPVRLETDGLPPALEELAKAAGARFKIKCRFHSQGPVAVENAAVATHLYRIAQEALTNAIKHSQARTVSIRLKAGAKQIELRVEDDGAGFPPAKRAKATGMGLHIMDYRARAIGGTLRLGPGRRGGTVVSCCIPRGSS